MEVDEWNSHLLLLFIPLDILLVLFIIIGILGNALVIFVYGYKIKHIKDGQFFIPYLAVVDLMGTVICSLFGLSMTLMPAMYDLDILCKAGWLLGTITSIMSVFMLVIIAIQRYMKVCTQKAHILTLKWKRFLMILAFTMAIAFSAPSVATYGTVPFESSYRNLTGHICGKISGIGSLIYDIVLAIVVSTSCGILVVLYFLIGRTTYKCMTQSGHSITNSKIYSENSENDIMDKSGSTLDTDLKTGDSIESVDLESVDKENQKSFIECVESVTLENESSNKYNINKKKKTSDLKKKNQSAISKITVIFMIITTVFLICSIPKLTIVFLETITPSFWENYTDVERVVLMFVHQGYILNNIANPFIYTCLDKTFKREIKKIICWKTNE
jgi:hypothetical protein